MLDLFTRSRPAVGSLAAAPRRSLFGHGGQHLADVRGQQVVHFVALKEGGVKGQTNDSTLHTVLFWGLFKKFFRRCTNVVSQT